MNRRHLLALALVCAPGAARSARKRRLSREECQKLREQIDKLQSRLRAGYSAKQGRRYRERMRELQLKRFRRCR